MSTAPSSTRSASRKAFETVYWLILIAIGSLTLTDYGMGWDEPTRWASGDLKLEYYSGFAGAGNFWEHLQTAPRDTYPGFFDMTLALAARMLPIDRFLLGHVLSSLFGLAGLVAVRLLAAKVVRSPSRDLVGMLSVALLALLPNYWGHLFINPKDIPFAATMAWGLLGLVYFVEGFPRPNWRRTLLFGLSVGVSMSTRLPAGILLAYAGGLAALWLGLAMARKTPVKAIAVAAVGLLLRGLAAGAVAFLWLLPWWPAMHRNPFAMSIEAVERLHTDSSTIPVLFRGEMFDAGTTPAVYGLWMLLVTSPWWFLFGLISGLLVFAQRGKSWIQSLRQETDPRDWEVLAVLLAAFFPFAYVTIAQPSIHNGFRHLLYVLPPLAVLGAWSLLHLSRFALARGLRPIWIGAFCSLVGCQAIFTLIRLHPYEYVFANSLFGGPAGLLGHYETEYWFTSTKHGLEELEAYLQSHPEERPKGRPVRVLVTGPWQVATPFLPNEMELTGDLGQADFVLANTQMMVHLLFEGEEVFRIERAGLPILVALRDPSPAPLP